MTTYKKRDEAIYWRLENSVMTKVFRYKDISYEIEIDKMYDGDLPDHYADCTKEEFDAVLNEAFETIKKYTK